MQNNDPVELFCRYAHMEKPRFTYDEFMKIPEEARNTLVKLRFLEEGPLATGVVCDNCDEGYEEVKQDIGPDGKHRFFITCMECRSMVWVDPNRLRQWVPNYQNVAEYLSNRLNCIEKPIEIVSNRLWKLGCSSIAGKTLPFWLGRFVVEDMIEPLFKLSKDDVLFILGSTPPAYIGVPHERMVNLMDILKFENNEVVTQIDKVKERLQVLVDRLPTTPSYIFRRKGSMLQIRFGGQNEFFIPLRKGVEYLRQLILSQGNPVNIFDIIAKSSIQACDERMTVHEAVESGLTISDNSLLSDCGTISDWGAVKEYRDRIQELLADKTKAEADNNTVDFDLIEKEIAEILKEINKAVNINGKLNLAGDKRKTLRDAFRVNIKRVIDEIAKTSVECAEHFQNAISFGNNPSYRPGTAITWETNFLIN